MREIKFRAWSKEDKKMEFYDYWFTVSHHGYLCFQHGPDPIYVDDSDVDYPDTVIVMQYTGLKDKNGVEIFENDILEHPEYGNCKVIYRHGGFGIEAKTSSWINTGFHSFSTRSADYEHCEVLGNLYENPNLLSQDK